ncbi:HAD-like domain-containing protein [Rhodocollybia butyracea]|uniref:HAD-like domain-containing protein n=1 Tax=Rhodocollybia butyracea TaxID=206335 RepID=A0A9P5Q9S5_9AGAR|nr:HAD-like domain-containing protein [Rhodocollybia butyracea]
MPRDTPKLTDFKVLVFDVYATLVDWEKGIYENLRPLLSKYPVSSHWSRRQTLEAYQAVELDLQAKNPQLLYCDILAKTHEVMEERLRAASGIPIETSTSNGGPALFDSSGASTSNQSTPAPLADKHVRFGESIKDWPVFPDSSAALHELSKYYKLVVLSNVDRKSFAYTLAELSEGEPSTAEVYSPPNPIQTIGSLTDVGSYKPDLNGFKVALDVIQKDPALNNTPKDQVLWVAQSDVGDLNPASQLGIATVFIDRKDARMGFISGKDPSYTWKFDTLAEMVEAVAKETN